MATEKRNLLKGDFSKKNALLFALAVLVTIVLWNLPTSSFGIEGLTVIQQRIIAVFALATILDSEDETAEEEDDDRVGECSHKSAMVEQFFLFNA